MKKSSSQDPAIAGRLLLVDDNRNGLTARKALLEEQGFVIATATNGEEGFEALSEGAFDLMITDFKMPKMNGIELIRRAKLSKPDLPAILLSGYVEGLGFDAQSTGADVVIAKGTNEIAHLLRAVTRLIARRTPRKPSASQKKAPPQFKAKSKSV